jgi:serine protease Do
MGQSPADTTPTTDKTRFPRLTRGRAAAAAFGLGATLALSPMVLAENPAPATPTPPQTMTSPVALIQQQSFAPLVKKVLPAVVNISVTQKAGADQMSEEQEQFQGSPFQNFPNSPFDEMLRRFFEQQNPGGEGHASPQMPEGQPQRIALGSGFIIDPSGYIVTNDHVVGSADHISVGLSNGTELTARVIGTDELTDVALIKVESPTALPFVSWGDSRTLEVGDWVVAAGNPFGLGGSITAGIVSARGRDIGAGPFDDFIQVDAPINPGNSGGPVFNTDGLVVGMDTAIASPTGASVGIGFAIPSEIVSRIVAELREKGRVERGWLGAGVQDVPNTEGSGNLGVGISSVERGGPAAHGGLRPGDVVTAVNGQPVDSQRGFVKAIASTMPGNSVRLTLRRQGREIELTLPVGRRPSGQG